MKLLYYYPCGSGAPSNVARNIFNSLLDFESILPFEDIFLFTNCDKNTTNEAFDGVECLTGNEVIKKLNKDFMVHIPVSPSIFPNKKCFLHVLSECKGSKLLINYHGDVLNELVARLKYEHRFNFLSTATCLFLPMLLKNPTKLIVNSYLMENLVKERYNVKKTIVIPNAISDFWFENKCEIIEPQHEMTKIFYHGRLSPEKGVDLVVQGLLSAVRNGHEGVVLYIAGDGAYKSYLKKMARDLRIDDKILFLGDIDKPTLKAYLKHVDVAIYPSRWDGFSLSIMEALAAANCPIYFSKTAGVNDFVTRDGFNLNQFEPDVENISEIIINAIEKRLSKSVVLSQKDFAIGYTWDKVIKYYIDVYKEIANGQKG